MDTEKRPRRDWFSWLISLFGLDEYGQKGLARGMRTTLISFAFVLIAVATLELIGWTYRWYLVTGWRALAIPLGIIFAGAAVLLDRAIIVLSSKRWPSLGAEIAQVFAKTSKSPENGATSVWRERAKLLVRILAVPVLIVARLGLLYALAYYTALPFSVLTFKSEIEQHQAEEESQRYAELVDKVVQKVETEFGRQIEAGRREAEQQAAGLTARTATDVEAYKKQRAVERVSRIESLDAAIEIQKGAVERFEKERNIELDQGAGVRASGAGKFYRTKDGNYAKEQEQLRALQTAKIQELRQFDEETLKYVAGKETTRDAAIAESAAAVERLRAEMRDKIKQLRHGPIGSVPGEWRVSRGYAAQELALAKLEQADKTGTTTRKHQETHWLMMAFGFMVVILKMGLDAKISTYYDPYAQAASGNVEARAQLGTSGITNFAAYVRPTEVKLLCVELGDRREALDQALIAFKARQYELAGPVPESGRFRRRHTIQTLLHKAWIELVEPARKELREFERRAREFGIVQPEDAEIRQLWIVTDDTLAEYGWQPPSEESLRTLEAAYQRLLTSREQLLGHARTIEARAAANLLRDHGAMLAGFQQLRQSVEQQLLIVVSQIVAAEATIRAYGEVVPEWSGESPNKFLTLFWHRLEQEVLMAALIKARQQYIAVMQEADRQLELKLRRPEGTFDSPREIQRLRKIEFLEKLRPLQEVIESCEARCDQVPPWPLDPRPYENFWTIDAEKMKELGWVQPYLG